MIYMVGSNLESQSNLASMDILETLESGIDSSRFNVVIYCGGAKSWGLNISSEVRLCSVQCILVYVISHHMPYFSRIFAQ